MRLNSIQIQLIVRNENLIEDFSIDSHYVIYSGLGHVVLDSDLLKNSDLELFNKIKEENEDNYFFRASFMENPEDDKEEVRCYLTKELNFFKAKKINKTKQLCFLGIDFTIVTLKKVSLSKNFDDVPQYFCEIKNIRVDDDGNLEEDIIWKKTKYGNIEKFLPKELEKYSSCVESARKRIYFKK